MENTVRRSGRLAGKSIHVIDRFEIHNQKNGIGDIHSVEIALVCFLKNNTEVPTSVQSKRNVRHFSVYKVFYNAYVDWLFPVYWWCRRPTIGLVLNSVWSRVESSKLFIRISPANSMARWCSVSIYSISSFSISFVFFWWFSSFWFKPRVHDVISIHFNQIIADYFLWNSSFFISLPFVKFPFCVIHTSMSVPCTKCLTSFFDSLLGKSWYYPTSGRRKKRMEKEKPPVRDHI